MLKTVRVTAAPVAEASEEPMSAETPEEDTAFSADATIPTIQSQAAQPTSRPMESNITLELIPKTDTSFTNAILHYVYFDAQVQNADMLTMRVLDPEGEEIAFRTRRHVDSGMQAARIVGYNLGREQAVYEDLNVLFPSGMTPGIWAIEVTAYAGETYFTTRTLPVIIRDIVPLRMDRLGEVHDMLIGVGEKEVIPVEKGKIRFVSQNPGDSLFVKEYWLSKAYDLRDTANQKCTRAVFSMALSWLGIDLTPVRMSDMVRGADIEYTYDSVCRKLGNVERVVGDLETLWPMYEAGEASPVLLHFKYDGGMHAVLLVARDEEDPHLFYAVTSSQRVNTSAYPDGVNRDVVIPILIEQGESGQRIQSPLLNRYHKGVIDQIWLWRLTDE